MTYTLAALTFYFLILALGYLFDGYAGMGGASLGFGLALAALTVRRAFRGVV